MKKLLQNILKIYYKVYRFACWICQNQDKIEKINSIIDAFDDRIFDNEEEKDLDKDENN